MARDALRKWRRRCERRARQSSNSGPIRPSGGGGRAETREGEAAAFWIVIASMVVFVDGIATSQPIASALVVCTYLAGYIAEDFVKAIRSARSARLSQSPTSPVSDFSR